MSKILILSDETHAALATYLVYCQEHYISAEEKGVPGLLAAVQAEASTEEIVQAAVAAGVTPSQFVQGYGVPLADNPYAQAAEQIYKSGRGLGDDVEFDDSVIVNRSVSGAFVSARVWVSSSDAGVEDFAEILEDACDYLEGSIQSFDQVEPVLCSLCDYLRDQLCDAYGQQRLDRLSFLTGVSPVSKVLVAGEVIELPISGLVRMVTEKAASLGYDKFQLEQVDLWLAEYGVALDTEFHVVHE